MTTNTLIARTSVRGLEPIHPRLLDSYDQILGVLHRRLGSDHAALFAEPSRLGTGAGSDMAWYAPGDVEPRNLNELAADAARGIEADLQKRLAEIEVFAKSLLSQGDASRELGNLLQAAVNFPDRSCIWVVQGKPVLVNWGHRRRDAAAGDMASSGMITAVGDEQTKAEAVSTITTDAPPSEQVVRPRLPKPQSRLWASALLWCAFALVVSLLALRLLQACALGGESWSPAFRSILPQYCPYVASEAQVDADRAAMIEAQIRSDELAIAKKIATCDASCRAPARAAVQPATPPIQPTTPPTQDEITHRLPANVERGQFLEITLTWDGPADLDLHVGCPGGSEISFQNMEACGGKLVADANRDGGAPQSRAAEHIIWSAAPPPAGTYRVSVGLYKRYGETRPRIPFHISIWRDGRIVREEQGEATVELSLTPVLTLNSPLE